LTQLSKDGDIFANKQIARVGHGSFWVHLLGTK
jgi:hypothetical protein